MKLLAIALGKLGIVAGKILKRGSSLPGDIALKIDKNLLKKLELPETKIAVTGSSGKGSTSSIIAHVYRSMGYNVIHNASGANLSGGITTTLLENCTMSGKVKGDVFIFEMDERFAKFVFPDVKPSHIVITNITRDQPPRQGHVDLVYNEIKKALPEKAHLILNADDPYLLNFNLDNEYETTYYSLDKTEHSYEDNKFKNLNVRYCPKCNAKLVYDYYHFETNGKYHCKNCDFKTPAAKYTVTHVDYPNYTMTVDNRFDIKLQYDLLYSVYNTMAAYTTCCSLGLDCEQVAKNISSLNASAKMYNHYKYNDSDVYVLNNKNENSTTFNQSLLFTERFKGSKTVVIGWKEISRRYAFDDLSWLYDIDFEILNTPDVKNIICAGPNAYDIASRLLLAGYPNDNIYIFNNLTEAKEAVDMHKTDYIFGILNFDYVEPFKQTFTKKEEVQ